MKLHFNLFSIVLLLNTSTFVQAQDCSTYNRKDNMLQWDEEKARQIRKTDAQEEFILQRTRGKIAGDSVVVIPTVVHVLHYGGASNIAKSAIMEGIAILNLSYRRMNADTVDIAPFFDSISADMQVEFRLAQVDPDGNCTDGITRHYTSQAVGWEFVGGEDYKPWVQNQWTNPWAPEKYFNIYLMKDGSYAFATGPGGDNSWPDYSGVVSPYNWMIDRSLMAHEAGHWLNLRHTWGPTDNPLLASNCNSDDLVGDTPNCQGTYTCNLTLNSCDDGGIDPVDNVQNYMDYTYCTRMFTEGQKTRAQNSLGSGTAGRNNLGTLGNLIATGTEDPYVYGSVACAPILDFNVASGDELICIGNTASFEHASYGAPIDSVVWTFTGGTPTSSSLDNPTITYNTAGNFDVQLTAYSGPFSTTETIVDAIEVLDLNGGLPLPYIETFENTGTVNSDWNFFDYNNDGFTWELTSSVSYAGSQCLKMHNNFPGEEGMEDEVFSPLIDLSSAADTVVFTFMLAAAQRSDKEDLLQVFFSKTCGVIWNKFYEKQGAELETVNYTGGEFTPSGTGDWRQEEIVLPLGYRVSDVMFKFKFTTDEGTSLYIDNINYSLVGLDDLSVSKSLRIYPNPVSASTVVEYELNTNEEVQIEITDILGRTVHKSPRVNRGKGIHRYELGKQLNEKGIYFVRIKTDKEEVTRKVVLY